MNNIAQAIWVEILKARRSKMPLFTVLGFSLIPLALGFFMIVLKNPELALRVGLISAKAHMLAGAADWPTFLGLLVQATMGGLILFGIITIWVFGREYSDHTAKDLLALPTSRSSIVMAKFVVIVLWSIALTLIDCIVSLGVGAAIGFPPASKEVFLHSAITVAVSTGLIIALGTPIAFFASVGRGYLPAFGATILVMFLANFVAAAGWGEYFPWSIPALVVQGDHVGIVSYMIVILTSIAGIMGTLIWWELADQTR